MIDAAADLQQLESNNETLFKEKQKLETELSLTGKDHQQATAIVSQLKAEAAVAKEQLNTRQTELTAINKKYTTLVAEEETRKQNHANAIATLNNIQERITDERKKEIEDTHQLEINRLNKMKETWNRHETQVNQTIKSIAERHTIQYVEKVPFRGEPDNTVKICDEFVIFDAKSPGTEDLKNFSSYLKDQAERAKKYTKQENVKNDIFFVVPSNTLETVKTHVHRMGDYNVYIIATDALEPILLSLKKIEDYEFVKELSPEDRENICRIIGKFGHLAKRRIQVDNFFARQFIQLAYKCEAELPADILEKVIDYEKAEKLNPPIEKRAKSINIKELGNEIARLKEDALAKGIAINDSALSSRIDDLPLYKKEEPQ